MQRILRFGNALHYDFIVSAGEAIEVFYNYFRTSLNCEIHFHDEYVKCRDVFVTFQF